MVRAVRFSKTGGPDVLELVNDFELPPAQPGEVVVKVYSTSVNPVDEKARTPGWSKERLNIRFPNVPGGDIAGVVLEDGQKWRKGDRIIVLTDRFSGPKQDGSYAELALVKEEWAAPAPKNLSLEREAAAVPLVSLTAYQALASAELKPGARVLVTAASGGVGVFAVQLAKQLYGAYVVGTTGPKNLDFVKSLGADEVHNYRERHVADAYSDPSQNFDAIIDLLGGEDEVRAYSILKPGGTFVHIINSGTDDAHMEAGKQWTDKKYKVIFVQPNGQQLAEIVRLIEAGKLTVPIHKVWTLEQAADAQSEVSTGHSRGKNVIQVVQ